MCPGKQPSLVSRSFVHRALREATGASVSAKVVACITGELDAHFSRLVRGVAAVHANYARMLRMQGFQDRHPVVEAWQFDRAFTDLLNSELTVYAHAGVGKSVEAEEVTS